MASFLTMLAAWALSFVMVAAAVAVWRPSLVAKGGFAEGVLGLGLLLGLPTLLFALTVGWPLMAWLSGATSGPILPLAGAAALAIAMWLLTRLLLPSGWKGAAQALTIQAAAIGLIWGGLGLLAAGAS